MQQDPLELNRRVEACTIADRRRLAAMLRGARAGGGKAHERFEAELSLAEERIAGRRASVPRVTYPEDLPISQRRAEIAEAIRAHQVVVVCGETGSGKTTQLPKVCLECGLGVRGMIGHTQPRRIAARSVADRIAEELGVRPGGLIGYKVRFGDHTGPETLVKLMTDGVLLAETGGDRLLERYDTIIIDEAHERSLNIDFLLGFLRTLLPRRPDLKLIVTSATIDPERFATHFSKGGVAAPIIMVSGRTYPVEVRYRPPAAQDDDERDSDAEEALVAAVDELASLGGGDILAFFSGEREIREAAETLRKHHVPGAPRTAILPLYAKLSAAEQHKVFEPHPGRRIVLATNVAETSLTVPGIRSVIDTGLARINRYSTRTKVQRLEVEPISRASAEQRKGRCGRLGPGVCIRLYSEEDLAGRPEFTEPEILRTNLASVILQMKALRLGRVEEFPFVEAPDSRLIKDGYETLLELGAIDAGGDLTPLGAELARLPIDPRVGRMVLAARREACLAEMLVIAAFLSIQDPRERPMEAQQAADEKHAQFRDPTSDFLSVLKLWEGVRENRRRLSGSQFRGWCKSNFVSYMRVREWEDVHRQLADLAGSLGIHAGPAPADSESIHRALLTGLLSNVGRKAEQGEYTGARGVKFRIFPGSALFKKGPEWVVAAELVRTTQLYARQVGPVKAEWIEQLAAHLVKRSHFDPHWSAEAGKAFVFEKVSLHGLELVERRRVALGPVDPGRARELFIHHALVEGDARLDAPFLRHNRALAAELREMETRARRQDLLADAASRFAFYDALLPRDLWSVPQLEAWRKDRERGNPRVLFMSPRDVLAPGVSVPTRERYPDTIAVGEAEAPLRYRLDPGAEDDGVTAVLPIEAMAQVEPARLDWIVPGLLEEKVELLIKGLPKQVRRLLPGAGTMAARFVREAQFAGGELNEALARFLARATNVDVAPADFHAVQLPAYLRLRLEVRDPAGTILAAGRDAAAVRDKLGGKVRDAIIQSGDKRFTRDALKDWDFGDLPERVELRRGGMAVPAFPALVPQKDGVGLRLLDSLASAEWSTRVALRRLFILASGDEFRRQTMYLPGAERVGMQLASLGGSKAVQPQVRELVADRAFLGDRPLPRSRTAFDAAMIGGLRDMARAIELVMSLVEPLARSYHAVRLELDAKTPPLWAGVVADLREQLEHLCPPGFLTGTAWDRLVHLPRYLAGMSARLRKLPGGGLARDERHRREIEPWWRVFVARHAKDPDAVVREPAFAGYRWMLEEMRVSFFAQELRTAAPVSIKRLEEQWRAVLKGART